MGSLQGELSGLSEHSNPSPNLNNSPATKDREMATNQLMSYDM